MSKSKIFLFLCLSFILGVFIQSLLNFPQLLWLGILILGVVMAAIWWGKSKKAAIIGFCLVFLFFGAWRFGQALNPANSIKQFNDKGNIILVGKIIEEPDVRADNIKYKIKTGKVAQNLFLSREINFAPASGNLLLVAKKYPEYRYGDVLEISGKLKTPVSFEDFDYAKYLAKDDIYSVVYYPEIKLLASNQGSWLQEKLLVLKNIFKNSVNKILTEPQAAFLGGLLLGEKRGLPQELMDNFSRTGTTHIIALSGYNITIIAVALISLFNFFMLRRSVSFWTAVAIIILFVMMTGASPSVVRAAVMGILVLVARQAGRLYSIRNALIFAGSLMIYANPKVLTFDLGFQLSFAATLGLVYIGPILQNWFTPSEKGDFPARTPKFILSLKQILAMTLSAQIAVLPLLVINFGQLSLIASLANVLILLFIPITMLFGFLAGLAGIFWLALGKIFGLLAWLFLTYEIKIIELLAKIPLAAVEFKWNWWGGGIYYLVLVYLVWHFNNKNRYKFVIPAKVGIQE